MIYTTASLPSAATGEFLRDVLDGLSRAPKQLPCKYFYDERGSELFDRICELEEYYLTRTEVALLTEAAREISARLGPNVALLEYGSGSALKTGILLREMHEPSGYFPIDISRSYLESSFHG